LEASRGGSVTSQRHVTINIADSMARHLLMSLDGTRDRQQLVDCLMSIVNTNSLNLAAPGDSQEALPFNFGLAELDEKLSNLARLALLIG
jgi:methyltransferase-like protein